MKDDGHRFNTAEIDMAKHRSPEERRSGKPFRSFGRRTLHAASRIIIILVLCVAVILVWFNRYNFTPSNVSAWVHDRVVGIGTGDGYPYSINDMSVLGRNFLSVDKNAVFLSDTSLVVLNSTAKEIVSRQHSFASPVIKADTLHMLTYSLGGTNCRVETVGKTLRSFNADGKITAGAVSSGGRYALLTECDGYCGKLTVYTSDGKVKSYYWFSDYYPTAVALNDDGTKAAVTGISTSNGALVSAVYILDLNSSKVSQPKGTYSENMLFDVSWDSPSAVIAVGDKSAEIINPQNSEHHSFGYGDMRLTSYGTGGGYAAFGLVSYENTSNARLAVVDSSGTKTVSKSFGSSVKSVSFYGQSAAALSGGKVYFYSSKTGAAAGTANAGSDAKAVALRDESSAYVMGVSEIRLVKY